VKKLLIVLLLSLAGCVEVHLSTPAAPSLAPSSPPKVRVVVLETPETVEVPLVQEPGF
jgi:hypothetical protein